MRKKLVYTENQLKEINTFFKYCVSENTNFEDYDDVCHKATEFINKCEGDRIMIENPVALLAMSSVILSRHDRIENIIKRDFRSSHTVRLPLLDFLKLDLGL